MNIFNKEAMLQTYFELNATDESAREFIYMDIPQHFPLIRKPENCKNQKVILML